jgi:HD-GYP domain-containing protein (c-di-GMP phosphodiesterase class II)
MRSARVRSLACVGLLAFAIGAVVQTTGALDGLERETLTARFHERGAERPHDVVVVAIDAKTFDVLREQWPFPRSLHGEAIRRVHAAGASQIVYDVQFTEPTTPRQDLALYNAIGDAGGAVLATSESDGHGHTDVLGGDANLRRVHAEAAASDLHNDGSGTIVRLPRSVEGLDTIAVAAARRAGRPPLPAKAFDGDGAWIDWRGPPGTIPTVSFSDVIRGRFAPGTFRDKVVVIGASAPTLRDVHTTPVGGDEQMAGAEVQANAIWTALHGAPLRGASTLVSLLLIALLALMAPMIGVRRSAPLAGVSVFVVAGLYMLAAQLAFNDGVILDVVAPVTALLVGGFGTIAWSQLAESRARQAVARDNVLLERRVRERTHELWRTQVEIIERLGVAVEWRDAETGSHIERIGRFCERLALEVGMSPADAEQLRLASALHDVGKVGIPDEILTKPGPLTEEEWDLMKTHTTIGANILAGSDSPLIRLSESIALSHHEHWDGGGYPQGLAGEQIPLEGRICAVCDVFDALLSARPYKDPWPFDRTIATIEELSGSQFDPALVAAFLPIAEELHREWFAAQPRAAVTSA